MTTVWVSSRSALNLKTLPIFMMAVWVVVVAMAMSIPTEGQVLSVIHNFTGGTDGAYPLAVTLDRQGNIYGNTGSGYGAIYRLKHIGSAWILTPLVTFQAGDNAGGDPGAVTIGPNGTLYVENAAGGDFNGQCDLSGCGTVVNLMPPATACRTALCPWNANLLYTFGNNGSSDGNTPLGSVVFDRAGNMYGTTQAGGTAGDGTVYELSHTNGVWTESIIHSFAGGSDGILPVVGLAMDAAGNLYGTTNFGGAGSVGTVYELTPSGSGWTETVLYSFRGSSDGGVPWGPLIVDSFGNVYGTTVYGGAGNGGTVFELSPAGNGWTFNLIQALPGNGQSGPRAGVVMDGAGNLYGTTVQGGAFGWGSVYEMVRAGDTWTYRDLHDFTGASDGGQIFDGVVLDSQGNLYGAASYGGDSSCGTFGCGVVFEIAP